MKTTNPARSGNYLFTVGEDRALTYAAQTTNIAGINANQTPFPARMKDLFVPSNKIEHDPLIVQFLISEDYQEWIFFYKWILKNKNRTGSPEYWSFPCEIVTLDSQNQPGTRFVYMDCFPTTIDPIQVAAIGESSVIVCNVTFRYNQFKVIFKGEEIGEDWNGDLDR